MSGDVVQFPQGDIVGEGLSVAPDNVLSAAVSKLRCVVIVGIEPEGDLYVAGSEKINDAVALLERGKLYLLSSAS